MTMKRFWALLLVLSFLLAGCSTGKLAANELSFESDSKVVQTKFQPEELDLLTQQAEYAMVAATLQKQSFDIGLAASGYNYDAATHVGDLDQDGDLEMVYGYQSLTFDVSDGYYANIVMEEYGNLLMLGQDDRLYTYGTLGDTDDIDGVWYTDYSSVYKAWDGRQWNTVMGDHTKAKEVASASGSGVERETVEFYGEIDGKEVSETEWNAHLEDLALQRVTTTAADFTSVTVEKKHRNAVEQELFAYLQEHHDCGEKIVFDADGDGQKEVFMTVSNPLQVYLDSLESQQSYQMQREWLDYDFESGYTVILVSDPTDDAVVISAYCVKGYMSVYEEDISYDDGYLTVDGQTVALSSDYSSIRDLSRKQKDNVYSYVKDILENAGVSTYGFKWTDLCDSSNQELLCICNHSGTWYAYLFTLQDGQLRLVWQTDLQNSACYLVEKNNKQYLLDYYQWVNSLGGNFYTRYSYNLFRFGEDYLPIDADYQEISYSNNDQDATQISDFFNKFNALFKDAVIIGDPYGITGNQWDSDSSMDYGTMPENTGTVSEGKLGYVQIEDPASFLFLREGPGKEYDPVLIDPSNKDSYVKQALGSPVTILEEVQTGDSENPVWVKLRIQYGDREVIGYSSKRYIREAN